MRFLLDLVDLLTLVLRLDFLRVVVFLFTLLEGTALPASGNIMRPKAKNKHSSSLFATQHLLDYGSIRKGLTAFPVTQALPKPCVLP